LRDRNRIALVIDEPFNHDITGIYRVLKGGIIGGLFGADSSSKLSAVAAANAATAQNFALVARITVERATLPICIF